MKRTCPNCNLSFVKSEGCNKLVCLCGYSMCYVCREGLASQGYHHFCQHFRDRPGQNCQECNKCDLYRVEDEDAVVKRAREAAEKEWWAKQNPGANGGELMKSASKDLQGFDSGARGMQGVVRIIGNWESSLERLIDAVVV